MAYSRERQSSKKWSTGTTGSWRPGHLTSSGWPCGWRHAGSCWARTRRSSRPQLPIGSWRRTPVCRRGRGALVGSTAPRRRILGRCCAYWPGQRIDRSYPRAAPGSERLPWGSTSRLETDQSITTIGPAVLDEATYGRVQFHHRAVREYLAAWWVKRQLYCRSSVQRGVGVVRSGTLWRGRS